MKTMKITLCDDGSVKVDSRGVTGSEAEVWKELTALASDVGGELKVEKHVRGAHAHHHGDGKEHVHE